MGKLLDLSVFSDMTMDVILPDTRRLLRLEKPTQRMVIEILKYRELKPGTSPEKIMAELNRMTCMILNANDEGYDVSYEYVAEKLTTAMKVAIIEQYTQYIKGVQSDPN